MAVMAAVTIKEMRDAEQAAFALAWTEERLIDLAGSQLGHAIARYFPNAGTIIGYIGKGHNAADALVAMAVLRDEYGWNISLRNAFPIDALAPLTQIKWSELGAPLSLLPRPESLNSSRPLILLDGLLGIGANGAIRAPLLALAAEMEWLRQHCGATVVAVDVPSGMDADSGNAMPNTVTADLTFMIGNAKCGLLAGHAANFTGALALVPVEPISFAGSGDLALISPQTMNVGKAPRPFDFHKGMAGHVAIFAGSEDYTGAAVLAATGALCGGAGLVTLMVRKEIHALVASKCPPEVIVRPISSPKELESINPNAWVIGCGIGTMDPEHEKTLLDFISLSSLPMILDADALNLISKSEKIDSLRQNHLITPHPGEFRRLAPDLASLPRESAARAFVNCYPVTLLLKGCRTLVTRNNECLWCNGTGSPGMATGGQGDLLSGVIGACLAQGNPPMEAASLAAWICGRAAETALQTKEISEESLLPSDVARHLGSAFDDWKSSNR